MSAELLKVNDLHVSVAGQAVLVSENRSGLFHHRRRFIVGCEG